MDYLIIGHILKDLTPDGNYILGGTASYASVIANVLGIHPRIVTSFANDLSSIHADICNVPTKQSTTFQNIYIDEQRQQRWLSTATSITYADIPADWLIADIVQLAPMAQELDVELCKAFPNSLVGLTIQGWLRDKTVNGNVAFRMADDLLVAIRNVDVLILSLADCNNDRYLCDKLLQSAHIGVETLGSDGCDVHTNGEVYHIPTVMQEEIDPTGAGDVFATALLIEYYRCGNIIKAAEFANTMAGMSVCCTGIEELRGIYYYAHQTS